LRQQHRAPFSRVARKIARGRTVARLRIALINMAILVSVYRAVAEAAIEKVTDDALRRQVEYSPAQDPPGACERSQLAQNRNRFSILLQIAASQIKGLPRTKRRFDDGDAVPWS